MLDQAFVSEELVELIKTETHQYMHYTDGWCSPFKADILIDIIVRDRPSVILEIGVWGGKSLLPMAGTLKKLGQGTIFGIDPWDTDASLEGSEELINIQFWGSADHTSMKSKLEELIQGFQLNNHVRLICSRSEDVNPEEIGTIDILHIDGNHSEDKSYLDVTKWVPHLKTGGWIVFDDMTWIEKGKITTGKAVKWLDTNCVRFAVFNDTCRWGIWVKP